MGARPRVLALLMGAGLLAALAAPAVAAPTGTAVTKLYQLPCRDDVCGTGDRSLTSGSLVRGAVQVQVTSRSSLGLETLRLEASTGGAYQCWRTWSLDGATSVTRTFDWDTTEWPGTCGGGGARAAENGQVSLRAVATERASGDSHTSSPFSAKVNNRPTAPAWVSQPKPVGPEDGGPSVELSWYASPEQDVREYHYVRIDPNGREDEFAVSATNPGGQGCETDGSVYTCVDDAFGSRGFGGSYTYLLVAYRSSPSTADSCALPPGGGCVQSATSDERQATLDEPALEEEPPTRPPARVLSTGGRKAGSVRRPRPVGNGTSYASLAAGKYWKEGDYSSSLPYDGQTLLSPPPDDQPPVLAAGPPVTDAGPGTRQLWVYLAAGMMALVLAGHVARLARDPSR